MACRMSYAKGLSIVVKEILLGSSFSVSCFNRHILYELHFQDVRIPPEKSLSELLLFFLSYFFQHGSTFLMHRK